MPIDAYKSIPSLAPALSLGGLEPFARGGHRHCYVHPGDPDLCVKVPARPDDGRCRALQQRELEDYASLQDRWSEALLERVPAIEGVVETDLGVGIVSRLCRDEDGRISRNLAALLAERGLSPPMTAAMDELKQWLKAQRLVTRDTGPHNVVAMRLGEEEWRLIIVEGWVHRRYQWMARCHRAVAHYMIDRQLAKFDRRVSYLGSVSMAGRCR